MLEWLLGLLVLVIIIAAVLVYVEAIDLFDMVAAAVKLVASLLFAVGALFVWLVTRLASLLFGVGVFFVWLVRRRRQEKRP
jgi:hypothetical protein